MALTPGKPRSASRICQMEMICEFVGWVGARVCAWLEWIVGDSEVGWMRVTNGHGT